MGKPSSKIRSIPRDILYLYTYSINAGEFGQISFLLHRLPELAEGLHILQYPRLIRRHIRRILQHQVCLRRQLPHSGGKHRHGLRDPRRRCGGLDEFRGPPREHPVRELHDARRRLRRGRRVLDPVVHRLTKQKQKEKVEVFNIGTGRGVSVLELINGFEKATGVKLNYQIVGRRAGDIEKVWANPDYANQELGWKAVETLEDTLRSAWNWQLKLRERGIQ